MLELVIYRKEMGMEINFEKRYIPIYTLIVSATHHIFSNINIICGDIIKSIWPVDAIILILTLLFLSIFNRSIKERIGLGIIYSKTPFENASKYIKNDKRISKEVKESKQLENITNNEFYCKYYKPVRENIIVKSKNSEYCVIRDIVFTIFIITIVVFILTLIWPKYFYKELIASIVSYIVGIISCKMKSRDLVSQIVVEKINKEEE